MAKKSNNKLKSDAELLLMAQKDPELFGSLIERYADPLKRFLRRTFFLLPEDLEDITQEVFVKVYQKSNAYNPSLKFSSWIYQIARNHALDFLRKNKKRRGDFYLEEKDLTKIIRSSSDSEKEIFIKDCFLKVKKIISNLDSKYQEILILRFLEEKNYEEIADILKKPPGTIASLVARGKKILQKELKAQNINCLN
jgi:RNA polymerase sigma-70 factor (ECF subfamily)